MELSQPSSVVPKICGSSRAPQQTLPAKPGRPTRAAAAQSKTFQIHQERDHYLGPNARANENQNRAEPRPCQDSPAAAAVFAVRHEKFDTRRSHADAPAPPLTDHPAR